MHKKISLVILGLCILLTNLHASNENEELYHNNHNNGEEPERTVEQEKTYQDTRTVLQEVSQRLQNPRLFPRRTFPRGGN